MILMWIFQRRVFPCHDVWMTKQRPTGRSVTSLLWSNCFWPDIPTLEHSDHYHSNTPHFRTLSLSYSYHHYHCRNYVFTYIIQIIHKWRSLKMVKCGGAAYKSRWNELWNLTLVRVLPNDFTPVLIIFRQLQATSRCSSAQHLPYCWM